MSSVSFFPTETHRALKAVFLVAIKHLPPEQSYTQARIEQLCPGLDLSPYWSIPGFKEWFTNVHEWAELAEAAAFLALETCMDVMRNTEEKGQARVTAAKLAVEVADKVPKGKPVSALPKSINQMDEEQLKAFIQGALPSIK